MAHEEAEHGRGDGGTALMGNLGVPKELNMLFSMPLGDPAAARFQFYPISLWN